MLYRLLVACYFGYFVFFEIIMTVLISAVIDFCSLRVYIWCVRIFEKSKCFDVVATNC